MTTNQTIDGVPREWLEEYEALADLSSGTAQMLRALLDAPAPITSAIGHIEQRRSMGLAIGSPITNVIWDLPHPELQHLPDGAKVYLHPAAQPQGGPVGYMQKGASAHFVCKELFDPLNGYTIPLYAEQPEPVAMVMPERKRAHCTGAISDFRTWEEAQGWNACLDEVIRLNAKS